MNRSEIVTIRLDPKLRYLTELASRRQRRTVSSFIESAIGKELRNVSVEIVHVTPVSEGGKNGPENLQLNIAAEILWDPDEPDRLAKLGLYCPQLLNYEEQVLWKLIRESGFLWEGEFDERGRWTWQVKLESLNFPKLREYWDKINIVAAGEADNSILPEAPRKCA